LIQSVGVRLPTLGVGGAHSQGGLVRAFHEAPYRRPRGRVALAVAAPAAAPATPVDGGPQAVAAKQCRRGYTHAVMPDGAHKCLRAGQFCSRMRAWQRTYHRKGFNCKRNRHLTYLLEAHPPLAARQGVSMSHRGDASARPAGLAAAVALLALVRPEMAGSSREVIRSTFLALQAPPQTVTDAPAVLRGQRQPFTAGNVTADVRAPLPHRGR
jgi:hypothetical protein